MVAFLLERANGFGVGVGGVVFSSSLLFRRTGLSLDVWGLNGRAFEALLALGLVGGSVRFLALADRFGNLA